MALVTIENIDETVKKVIEDFGLKMQLRVGTQNTLKWVSPTILVNPTVRSYSAPDADPEVRIRSGSDIAENYLAQPEPHVVRRLIPGQEDKLEILKKVSTQLEYFYVIEHLTRDQKVDSWLTQEFLTRFQRENSYPVLDGAGKEHWIWFIREAITPLDSEDGFRTAYTFRAVINLERITREVKQLNKGMRVTVSPLSYEEAQAMAASLSGDGKQNLQILIP